MSNTDDNAEALTHVHREWSTLVRNLIESSNLTKSDPFTEEDHMHWRLVELRLKFDIFDQPHVLLIERGTVCK